MNPRDPLNALGQGLIVLGAVAAVVGLAILFRDKLPLDRLPLGRLPGDINITGERGSFHFPWVTCLIISIVLTLLLNFFRR